ncbi:DUF881 domain-containing protein [Phycicoccus endophyticus]|uniref:DUF881 domain-containing protein n=1 Tax=Phycicoccus endophyticus TaxID=1690220 RepID=A0A7G9R0Z7_9MICO|nr:DUF881 domain-containing protein [Phycicoccus endophyticus]NHI19571.1 DUF881 domain-containing protein [Phycicoccus endophyticus]QNN49272.1 DUF881 domain-containing protein [Phycicoccus endophyticus]GGL40229.1 membrane protein [Phycicoccus endophyticus]
MVGTHAGRVERPSPWPWLVPVAALVAGALFASSVRASHGEDLRADYARLPDLIREQTQTNAERAAEVDRLRAQVDDATAALAPGDLTTQRLERQAAEISALAGRTEVRGPALEVTLTDAQLPGGEVPAGADPDDYVIHQQDVQAVVNALWAGGAEAMMLQDQRVVSTSAVRCVGNTLILQGRVYSPPYVVTAIGDPTALQASLEADDDVDLIRQYAVAFGLGYDVEDVGEQTFPAYSGTITPEHAEVAR